jgi:multidrug efflux system outer membrane protein
MKRVLLRFKCATAAAVFLSGCAELPERQPLDVSMPDQFSIAVVGPAAPDAVAWWERYNDHDLNMMLTSGLADSPIIRSARAELRAAGEGARAAGLRVNGDATFAGTASSSGADSRSAGLAVDFLPFGGRQAEVALAEAQFNQAREAYLDTQRTLVADIVSGYVQLRYFQALLGVRQEELRLARSSLSAAEGQAEFNAATELEVLEARAFVAEVQSEIPTLRASVVQQQRRLAILLGLPPTGMLDALERQRAQPIPIGTSSIGIPADLLRNRPDVRETEYAYEVALAGLGIARANRLPRLSLDGLLRANVPGQTIQSGTVGVSFPVFSQPALAAEEAAAGARAEAAYFDWQQSVIAAIHEVERALSGLAFSSEALSAAQRAERLLERRASMLREAQATSGNFTLVDVIEADRALTEGREQVLQSARQLATDYLQLWLALGVFPQDRLESTAGLLDGSRPT